jgi:uncharacterized integral membrane protein
MAHPDHVPELDGFDQMTVVLYRAGFFIGPTGLLAVALGADAPGRWLVALGAVLCGWNVHLYDKRFRWLIPGFAWMGLLSGAGASALDGGLAWFFGELGLGLLLVLYSALALKEQLCFKVPLLRLVPAGLCVGALAHAFGPVWLMAPALGLAAAVLFRLAAAKTAQPLGFDIGDRSYYQL